VSSWQDWIFGNLPPPYTAQPSGWWDTLVGNPSRRAAQPSSRGALLGASYQGMPDTRATITDRRQEPPPDIASAMQNSTYDPAPYLADKYSPSIAGVAPGQFGGGFDDPMVYAANDPHLWTDNGQGSYRASFPQNWRSPVPTQAPYQNFPVGPNLPRGPVGTSVDPQMPYAGAHLPISPGDPGWTPPPSPSGPHNPQGDPPRPGYDRPSFPMGALSSQPFFQLWGGQ
jgi:hypothetical protein